MSLLGALGAFSLDLIRTLGYTGLFLLMVAESMILPVPSEAVLPFAGFLASTGDMSLGLAFAVSLAGTLVGSGISYALGAFGVRPLLERYGKYVFVTPHHLATTHEFFERKGGAFTIFVARFVPVVRHLISIPAGSARMPLGKFLVATAIGGGLWDFFLLYLGFVVGKNFDEVTQAVDRYKWALLAVSLVVAGTVGYVAWQRRKRATLGARKDDEIGLSPR